MDLDLPGNKGTKDNRLIIALESIFSASARLFIPRRLRKRSVCQSGKFLLLFIYPDCYIGTALFRLRRNSPSILPNRKRLPAETKRDSLITSWWSGEVQGLRTKHHIHTIQRSQHDFLSQVLAGRSIRVSDILGITLNSCR
jgi:hypothetical protein